MTIAIILPILASLFWSMTNHIDKYMITDIDSKDSIKVLLVFSSFITGLIFTPIWFILNHFSVDISFISLISVFSSCLVYIIATVFYFKAIEENDASLVVVMFQLIPVFSYILGLILFKENLTFHQMIGSIFIIISSIFISIDFNEKNSKKKLKALILMLLSSFFYALNFIFFDIAIRNSSLYSCTLWFQVAFLVIGLILFSLKRYRNPFIRAIKTNGKKYFALNITNEIINLIAVLFVNFSNVVLPIALVSVLTGFQGAFSFILGLIGTLLLPKFIKEDLSKGVVIQKVVCIVLGIIGLIILV